MQRLLPWFAGLTLLIAAPEAQGASAPTAVSRLDAIFSPLATGKTPGIAVLVRSGGRTVFAHGYGARELKTFAPIDSRTDFRLASFTKQFTAMAIMLLVHDGKLSYDRRLTDIFPEFPAYGRAITVRNLLTHTAGLPDYEDLMDEREKGKEPRWTATHQIHDDEVLSLLEAQKKPKFAAGASWAYSNSAYVVLGLAVAKIAGEPFGQFLRRRIFQPLHMDRTLVFEQGKNSVPNRAFGYSKRGDAFIETDQSATSATLGDGGVYSNIEDLAKWDEALGAHTLLPEDEMRAAYSPARLNDRTIPHWPATPNDDNLDPGQPVQYGFGWFVDPYGAHARLWHSGTTTGFRTAIERFPNHRLTVIVLCNRADLDASSLALRAADVFLSR